MKARTPNILSHALPPRKYPLRFGMKIVTLKQKFKALADGKPEVQHAPDLREQLSSMSCGSALGDLWEEAHLKEALVYLWGNQHLSLPAWARPLLPTEV